MDNNQWNNGQPYNHSVQNNIQQPYNPNGQPNQNGQLNPYGGQFNPNGQPNPYGGQLNPNGQQGNPYYQPGSTLPAPKKKGPMIALYVSLAVIGLLVILIVIGKNVTSDGYRHKRCENCKEVKECRECALTWYDETRDYWVCDDCFEICAARAEMKGGSLVPKHK